MLVNVVIFLVCLDYFFQDGQRAIEAGPLVFPSQVALNYFILPGWTNFANKNLPKKRVWFGNEEDILTESTVQRRGNKLLEIFFGFSVRSCLVIYHLWEKEGNLTTCGDDRIRTMNCVSCIIWIISYESWLE